MTRYILFKHYRGAPPSANDSPMDEWTSEEVDAHIGYMEDFAEKLKGTGEYVDSQALSPNGEFVRASVGGSAPETSPIPAEKALTAGWMIIDVDSYDRALALAAELSAAPGAGGRTIHEWLEVRPFLTDTSGE